MYKYIIRMKELVDQKDNIIDELNKKMGKMSEELVEVRGEMEQKANRCKILEEEVLGYENKIQQLEGKSVKRSQKKEKSMGESILSNSSYPNPDPNIVNLTESMYSDV